MMSKPRRRLVVDGIRKVGACLRLWFGENSFALLSVYAHGISWKRDTSLLLADTLLWPLESNIDEILHSK